MKKRKCKQDGALLHKEVYAHPEFAFFVLLVAVFSFYLLYLGFSEKEEMSSDADRLIRITVIGNTPDADTLAMIAASDYMDVKKNLGVKNEFVIYFLDQSGDIIPIIKNGKNSVICIGNPDVGIEGERCA